MHWIWHLTDLIVAAAACVAIYYNREAVLAMVDTAKYTRQSVEVVRSTSQAQLFGSLMTEYGSPEMGQALRRLRAAVLEWSPLDPDEFASSEGLAAWAEKRHFSPLADDPLDDARRRVSEFYRKVARIIGEQLLTGGLADELRELSGARLMHEVVIPMDRALGQRNNTLEEGERWIARFGQVFVAPSTRGPNPLPGQHS